MQQRPVSTSDRTTAALAITVGLVAGVGCGGQPDLTLPGDPSVSGQHSAIVCGDADEFGRREHYVLTAINRKLAYYPDFAADIGVESVATCEEARHFKASYYAYLEAHPAFDRDQPLGPLETYADPPLDGPAPTLEVAKVRGGLNTKWAYPNSPVVQLTLRSFTPGVESGLCTGTFVARNFILTDAHCLALTVPPLVPPRPANAVELDGYPIDFEWVVDWPDPDGGALPLARLNQLASDLLQIPHPDYMGSGFGEHDLALLYFNPHTYDLKLPQNIHDGAAMRISLSAPDAPEHANESFFFAGFASPLFPDQPGDPPHAVEFGRLRFGRMLAPSVDPFLISDTVLYDYPPEDGDPNNPPPPNTQVRLCRGDSGGPAYRFADVSVRTTPGDPGTTRRVPILVGNNVDFERITLPRDDTHQDRRCAQIGDKNDWVRVDGGDEAEGDDHAKLGFVRATIERYKGACHEGVLAQGGEDHYLQCWGEPCTEHWHCDETTEYCSRPFGAERDLSYLGECRPK